MLFTTYKRLLLTTTFYQVLLRSSWLSFCFRMTPIGFKMATRGPDHSSSKSNGDNNSNSNNSFNSNGYNNRTLKNSNPTT